MDTCNRDLRLSPHAVVVRGPAGVPCFALNLKSLTAARLNDAAFALLVLAQRGEPAEALAQLARRLPGFVATALEMELLADRPTGGATDQGRVCRLGSSVERLFIELTATCNLRCLHCYGSFAPGRREHLELRYLERLVDQAYDLGVYKIDLTGGEPLLHPEFIQVLQLIARKSMVYTVFSNLTHLPDVVLEHMRTRPPACVVTSVESIDAATHDSYRGRRGSHAKTVRSMLRLKEAGIATKVNVVVGKHNHRELEATLTWLHGLGVQVVVDTVHAEGRATASLQLSPTELRSLGERMKRRQKTNVRESCGVAAGMVYVDATGALRLCPSLTGPEHTLGNAKAPAFSLEECVRDLPQRFPEFTSAPCTATCVAGDHCDGGCRARALTLGGRASGPDPEMCLRFLHEAAPGCGGD